MLNWWNFNYFTLIFMKDFLFKICWFAASTIRFLKEITIFFKLKFEFFAKFKIFSDFYCNSFANFVQSALIMLYKEFKEFLIISASFINIVKWITSSYELIVISSSIYQFLTKISIADVINVKLIIEKEFSE